VQVYDIGDVDKTKLMIEKIDKTLDELKYTQTRIVAIRHCVLNLGRVPQYQRMWQCPLCKDQLPLNLVEIFEHL
jgi:hypothetical protein